MITTIEIQVLAYFANYFPAKKFFYSFKGKLSIYELLHELNKEYNLESILYLSDGTITDETRILLRGRDIRFLKIEQLILQENDIVLIMPMLAGG